MRRGGTWLALAAMAVSTLLGAAHGAVVLGPTGNADASGLVRVLARVCVNARLTPADPAATNVAATQGPEAQGPITQGPATEGQQDQGNTADGSGRLKPPCPLCYTLCQLPFATPTAVLLRSPEGRLQQIAWTIPAGRPVARPVVHWSGPRAPPAPTAFRNSALS